MNTALSLTLALMISALLTAWFWDGEMTLKGIATDAGFAAAILTAGGVIWSKGLRPFWFHVRHVNNLLADVGEMVKQHREVDVVKLAADIAAINHDLRPNSGTSLRDSVDRIESRIVLMDRINWAIRQDGPVGVFICDQEGRNIDVNRTFCRWLGVGSDELLGHGWRRFLAGTSAQDGFDEDWALAFAQGREVEFTIDLRSVNGTVENYAVHAYPLTTPAGATTEYLGVLRRG